MTTQDLDFTVPTPVTGDTGERTAATAIRPLVPGDAARAINLNRPLSNLWNRTEVLRQTVEDLLHKTDSQFWFISGGDSAGVGATAPKVTWTASTGIFVVDTPLVLQNRTSPVRSVQETRLYSFGSPAAGYVSVGPSGLDVLRAYNGANRLQLIWENATAESLAAAIRPGVCDLVISGSPEHIITIRLVDTGEADLFDLQAVIDVKETELTALGVSIEIAGDDDTLLDWTTITDPIYPLGSTFKKYTFSKTYERELHYIVANVFSNFFSTLDNCLFDGDTLAIAFATYEDRRKSFSGMGGDSTVEVGDLFNSRVNPEKLANCLPLCKRIGPVLYWIDGTVCASNIQVSFSENSMTVERTLEDAIHIAEVIHAKHQPYYIDDSIVGTGGTTLHTALINVLAALQGKKPIDTSGLVATPTILSTVNLGGTTKIVREFANSSGIWRVVGGYPDPADLYCSVLPDVDHGLVYIEGYTTGQRITAFNVDAAIGVPLNPHVTGDWTQYEKFTAAFQVTTLGVGHKTLNADLELGDSNKLYRTAITPVATATPLIQDVIPGGSSLPKYLCIYQSGEISHERQYRLYCHAAEGFVFTQNAFYNESTSLWNADFSGYDALRIRLGGLNTLQSIDRIIDAPATWSDNDWTSNASLAAGDVDVVDNRVNAMPTISGFTVQDTVRVYCDFVATVPGDPHRRFPITWHGRMLEFTNGLQKTLVDVDTRINTASIVLTDIDEFGAILDVSASASGQCYLNANMTVWMPTP